MNHFTRGTADFGRKTLWKMKMVVSQLLTLVTVFAFTAISAQRIDASGGEQSGIKGLTSEQEKQVRSTLKKNAETLRFLENKGQVQNSNVLYYFEGLHGSTYIEKNRIRFVAKEIEYVDVQQQADARALVSNVTTQEPRMKSAHTFTLYFDGSKGNNEIELGDEFTTSYNYMLGETESEWITDVKAAKDLTIKNVYPGIDLRLYSNSDGSFEFDWIMASGANFNNVKMRFEGQDAVNVAKDGSLEVALRFTTVRFNIPESFQITPAGKSPVNFSFAKSEANLIGFSTTSTIDNRYPVVIDPTLSWGTFFDGNVTGFDQYLFAIQVDTDGIVYCAGGSNQQIATGSAPYDANGYLNSVSGFSTSSATPRVAIVYRISSDGTDLLDMTLYGPSTVVNNSGSDFDTNVIAYGLSLSANNVFICGKTNSDIPTIGSPFDSTRGGTFDGFVAVFTKDLGTLNYATYLGSTGSEDPGATSIRALSNNSFVVGLTAEGALPAAYISAGAADGSNAGDDMYIAKFTSFNSLAWGTYVGGDSDETFNDLEVFADGRVAFAGFGFGQLTEVNSAAGRSTGTGNEDGIIGVLNASGTAFNYLDEIGGVNNDEINDVQIVGSTLYWTGSAESGFPTSSGAYDTSHNGGLDAVVGSVSETGGSGSYKCTFYGGSGDEIGSGIRPVNQVDCDGIVNSFLLVFGTSGTSGSGLPTLNINSDPFFDSSNNGGLDMFFAGFASDMASLQYATLMGGSENDYLGDTGAPRGANHLWTNGANVYLGTTTHSASHSPTLVGNGGFDTVKTNNNDPASDDTHLILGIEFASLLGSDYGDAPASYGAPAHVLDCPNLYLGAFVDDEASHQSSANANGDDNLTSDDEDSVTVLPILVNGSGQTFSITVNSLVNTTGSTANLYAWIDLNGDGQFGITEFVSTTVANGFAGSKTLTWSGVTVSGNAANRFLRVRITTDGLTDNPGTSSLDERSSAGASNGEVEDYRCTSLSCPVAQSEVSCQTQAQINAKYQAWIATATYGSACGGGITVSSPSAPDACLGGTATITIEFENICGDKFDCTSTFTVLPASTPGISCPANQTTASCLTQAQVNDAYAAWLASAFAAGGCNGVLTHDGGNAPNACTGGTKNVTFTYTTSCASPVTCMASFTVPASPAIVLTCPSNTTSAPCLTQAEANAAFVAWLGTATASGGCNGVLTNDGGLIAPSVETGGTKTVTFTYTSTCGATTTTCSATYTVAQCCDIDVDAGPDVITCPPINTVLTATVTGAQNCETPGYSDCTHAVVATTGFAETPSAAGICTDNAGTKLHTASGQGVSSITLDFGSIVPAGTELCARMKLEHCNNATNPSNQSNAKIEVATAIGGPYTVVVASVLFTGGYQNFCYNLGTAARYVKITDNSGCAFRVDYVNINVPGTPDSGVDYAWSGPGIVGASNGPSITVNQYGTYIVTVTDCAGCEATDEVVVSENQVPPTLVGVPDDTNAPCDQIPPVAVVTATDAFGNPLVVVFDSETTTGCPYTITRTWTATDACGNSTSDEQIITVNDEVDPQFTSCPQGANLGCNPTGVPAPGNAVATDNCGVPVITSSLGPIIEDGCTRTQVRTYVATDACGNTANCYQTFTWTIDHDGPTFTYCPPSADLGCNPTFFPGPGNATATDNCSGEVTITSELGTISEDGCYRTQVRTYTATDACGNTSTCAQTYTWKVDLVDPLLEDCPAPTAAYQCYSAVPAPADVKAFDLCDGVLDVVFTETQSDTLSSCNNTIIRTWTATDECGNDATCSQIIYVNDIEKPTFNFIPENINGQCGEIPLPSSVTASDNCDMDVSVIFDEDTLSETCPITVVRRWTATDDCGNVDSITQTITFDDTINPVFTVCPQGGDLGCNPEEIPAAGGAEATDNCGVPTITSFPGDILADGCYRSFTRTYVATDYCGNTAYCYQVFTWKVDVDGPTFTFCPQGGDLGCNPILFPGPGQAIATDNCEGDVTITSALGPISEDGCYRSQIRTYTATDACGNESYCYQTYSWTIDHDGPTFTYCPPSADLGCNPTFFPGPGNATATDNCSGEVTITSELGTISEDGCYRTQVRTYTATDACGNTSTCAQTYTWKVDLVDPLLEDCPAPTAAYQCYSAVPAPADVKAFDLCDGVLDVVFTETQSDTLSSCQNTIVRTWTATDACGNSASCSQIIYVNDTVKPTFNTIPEDVNGQCGEIPLPSVVTADDNCDLYVDITFDEDTLSETCPITILRTWTATDDCGNEDSISQTITFDDTVNPVFTVCPAGGDLGCNPEEIPAAGGAEATDNCGVPSITSFPGDIVADGCYRSFTRTYVATDYCGNVAYCYQTYTWTVDLVGPTFTFCPQGGDLGCNPIFFPGPGQAIATDNCEGDVTITSALGPISEDGCYRSQIRTYTATDACGNESYCYQTYSWIVDLTPPQIVGTPLESEVEVSCYTQVPELPQVGAIDNCLGQVSIVFTQTETDTLTSCDNTITRTWTATDLCGNSASWSQTIHVQDNVPPTVQCPADIIVGCNEEVPAPAPGSVVAYDNCSDLVYLEWVGDVYGDTTCVSRYIIERTYRGTDLCGNEAYCVQEIGVFDSEGPELLELPDPNISCSETDEPQMPLFVDNCGGQYTVTYDDEPMGGGNSEICGQYTTFSKGGWGAPANGNNPGAYRDANFDSAFPSGLTIGCATGSFTFTTPAAIEAFIPSGGGAAVLPAGNLVNPSADDFSNNFADQLMAAILNTGFDAYDPNFGAANGYLGDLIFSSGVFTGMTADEVIEIANDVIGGCSNAYDANDLSSAMEDINLSFHEGTANTGDLVCENNNSECSQTMIRHWSAVDACGNETIVDQLIVISDDEDPFVITELNDTTVQCIGDMPSDEPVFGDLCDQFLDISVDISYIDVDSCIQVVRYVWTAMDDCGNFVLSNRDITIHDTTDPTVTYADAPEIWVQCFDDVPAFVVEFEDNCDDSLTIQGISGIALNGCEKLISRSWIATDDCGNSVSRGQLVHVLDTIAPTVTYADAPEIWVQCFDDVPEFVVEFEDNCDDSLTIEGISGIAQDGCEQIISRAWIATDDCGNSTSQGQVVHILDTVNPTIVDAAEPILSVECGDEIPAIYVVFDDNCDDELELDTLVNEVIFDCGSIIYRSVTATDNCDNQITYNQEIYVVDSTLPEIDCPADIEVTCSNDVPAPAITSVSAWDLCSGVIIAHEGDVVTDSTCANRYVIERTYSATDACANVAYCVQYITVYDDVDPEFTYVPASSANCNETIDFGWPEATDNCQGEVIITFDDSEITDNGQGGCYYSVTRTWIATDACGNQTTAEQVVTISDQTDPTITYDPADYTVQCLDEVTPDAALFADNCDLDLTITPASSIIPLEGCAYQIYRTWTATDDCGNFITAEQTITVQDTTDPTVTYADPEEIWVQCFDEVPDFVVEFEDNCDDSLTIEGISGIGLNGCETLISRSWIATDDCGNSVSRGQLVHILDTIDPVVLTAPADIDVACDGIVPVAIAPTFDDNCDEELTVIYDTTITWLNCGFVIHRTWTAYDNCENSVVVNQYVNGVDEVDPIIDPYFPFVTVECGDLDSVEGITASDNCGDVTITSIDSEVSGGCFGWLIRDYTVTDNCGNEAYAQIIIEVVDTTPPVIENPADFSVECDDVPVGMPEIEIYDNCGYPVEITDASSSINPINDCTYEIIWHWEAVDYCGNVAEATTVVTVTDWTNPTLVNVPVSASYECDEDWTIAYPTANDNCGNAWVVTEIDTVQGDCPSAVQYIYAFYAVDPCGNQSPTQYTTISIDDTTDPEFVQNPSNESYQCLDLEEYVPQVLTATDNCGSATVTHVITGNTDACGNGVLTVTYTAEDQCGNTATESYNIYVEDTEEPVFTECPEDIQLECGDAVPAPLTLTAWDACDNTINVVMTVTTAGDVPVPGTSADCEILTPVRSAGNPCGYPADWGMALFGLPKNHRFYKVTNGQFLEYPNGTITISADFVNVYDANNGWHASVTFWQKKDWIQWSTQNTPTSFKADCGGVAANHQDWFYYKLKDMPGAELVGFGAYANSSLSLKHAPINGYFGFQLGVGANNYNAAYGFGGWFTYSGTFKINNVPYGGSTGFITGAGDFAFELDCCPDYQITRTYTATDCSGNVAECVQVITIGNMDEEREPEADVNATEEDGASMVRVNPNPTNGQTWFSFTTQETAKTTLELYDMAGKKVTDIFIGQLDEGETYSVDYNAESLATGFYLYRLTNGTTVEQGKLIVNK